VVLDVGHVPKGNGRMINYHEGILGSINPLNKLCNQKNLYFQDSNYRERVIKEVYFYGNVHYKSPLALGFDDYSELIYINNNSNSIEDFIKLALKTWIEKI
jgi:hypothetical protein